MRSPCAVQCCSAFKIELGCFASVPKASRKRLKQSNLGLPVFFHRHRAIGCLGERPQQCLRRNAGLESFGWGHHEGDKSKSRMGLIATTTAWFLSYTCKHLPHRITGNVVRLVQKSCHADFTAIRSDSTNCRASSADRADLSPACMLR